MTWESGPCLSPPAAIDEDLVRAELAKLARRQDDGLRAVLDVGRWEAFQLIAVLQLAWRHPELSPVHRQVIEQAAAPLELMFDGILRTVIRQGWEIPPEDPAEGS